MLSVLMGLTCSMLGLWGLWTWRLEFIFLLKALLPISLVFAGIVAIIAGLANRSRKF